jgi:hypothetical protein
MKIKMTKDAHHRISSGNSLSYKKGSIYDVPQEIGKALIERKVAVAAPADAKTGSEETGNGNG